jgi:hypothetical protein
MKICIFAHKGRKRLYTGENAKGVRALTVWKVHTLPGAGTWSLSITSDRRLTFTVDDEREI